MAASGKLTHAFDRLLVAVSDPGAFDPFDTLRLTVVRMSESWKADSCFAFSKGEASSPSCMSSPRETDLRLLPRTATSSSRLTAPVYCPREIACHTRRDLAHDMAQGLCQTLAQRHKQRRKPH